MRRIWLTIGSLSMLLALVIAAASGHGPDPDPVRHQALETARELHFVHSLALLLVGLLSGHGRLNRWWTAAGAAFLVGIVCFPCGIYLHRLLDIAIFRPLVPVGGMAFMLGWLCFAIAALRLREH